MSNINFSSFIIFCLLYIIFYCISFIFIRANDSPYGTFGIADLSLQLVYAGEDIIRRLGFTITRQFGLQGSVDVTISIIYTDVSV